MTHTSEIHAVRICFRPPCHALSARACGGMRPGPVHRAARHRPQEQTQAAPAAATDQADQAKTDAKAREGPGHDPRHGRGQGHPPQHRDVVGNQERIELDRGSDLRRGHRQVARRQHRRLDFAPAGPCHATRRRSLAGHQHPRHVRAVRRHPAQRPRAGQHRRQPRRGIRPVPGRTHQRVTVYKTPDASLVGQGLSGTVDLQTIRPLSLGERRIVFSGQGEYNSLGKLTSGGDDKGYRAAFSYVDQFADDTIGVALRHRTAGFAVPGAALQGMVVGERRHDQRLGRPNPQPGKPGDAIALQGSEGWVKSRNLTRDGVMGVLEFKPNDTWHSVLDLYYSKFDQDETMRGTMWSNDPFFTGVNGAARRLRQRRRQRPRRLSLRHQRHADRRAADRAQRQQHARGQAVFGRLEQYLRVRPVDVQRGPELFARRTRAVHAGNLCRTAWARRTSISRSRSATSSGITRCPTCPIPTAVYLWDPQNYGHDGRLEDSKQTDIIKAARFSFNRVVESSDFLRSYDVGVNFNRRSKEKTAQVYFADLKNGRDADPGGSRLAVVADLAGLPRHGRRAQLRSARAARPLLRRQPEREQRRRAQGLHRRGGRQDLLCQGQPRHRRERPRAPARQRRRAVHPTPTSRPPASTPTTASWRARRRSAPRTATSCPASTWWRISAMAGWCASAGPRP